MLIFLKLVPVLSMPAVTVIPGELDKLRRTSACDNENSPSLLFCYFGHCMQITANFLF